jgi:hypothetical protein
MLFTPQYAVLQQELHSRGNYGVSGHKHADHIMELANNLKTRDVLDYGCGQCTLAKALPFAITNYDPFIPGYEQEPGPHDIVVCSDMFEHIEPECLESVLKHIYSLTNKALFVDVATRPAKKVLADGRNAHLIQECPEWWLSHTSNWFDVQHLQTYPGGFVAVFTPKADTK